MVIKVYFLYNMKEHLFTLKYEEKKLAPSPILFKLVSNTVSTSFKKKKYRYIKH